MAAPPPLPSPRVPTVTLYNGVEMPSLAFGTAPLVSPADAKEGKGLRGTNPNFYGYLPERTFRSVTQALESGLRHIDTAVAYRSHAHIRHVLGDFFASGRLEREDVFLTTKVMHPPDGGFGTDNATVPWDDMTPQNVREEVSEQFERALTDLGVGYVDLVLIHWPAAWNSEDPANPARRLAAWQQLEAYYMKGWARAIGVSNFSELHLRKLMEDGAAVKPMVNQIESSVYCQRTDIIEYCQQKGIVMAAYSPFGRGSKELMNDPILLKIASKHGRNPGQVALRYLVQKGFVPVFLSSSEERMNTNQDIFEFVLDRGDMEELMALNQSSSMLGVPSPYAMT